MIVLRPAQLSDISKLERLAYASGPMVSTLPAKRSHLLAKVERSIHSFEQEVLTPGEESYLFVLEEMLTGQLVGTGVVNALAGNREPFYSFRNDIKIHSSRELKIHSRIHALTLNHDLSDHSQLCSFYISPALADTRYPSLVTLGRLLFMSVFPMRFANEWMAVLPGISDKDGRAPFWEHVGRKFFGIDYNQVEYYNTTRDKTFVAEMMPYHPLYVTLINEEAQAVMGLVHNEAQLQCDLLSEQGFEPDKYVEIFDAGPILSAPRNAISLCQQIKSVTLTINTTDAATQTYLLGMADNNDFKACIVQGVLQGERLMLSQENIEQLNLCQKPRLFCVAL
ncbi:arginine N-succinyltransferase [Psychromonas sp. MB-3u-54]|uniref:arginine N-succinyltransferase n=1 Tax=Psychromonas sp. MB-3u-54 TaxID=2058319 RepID=UPI000C31E060|nr:arginine N-succinyltransferase [Psychromonas sp. MB-3u-54]PKH02833.1 arginine N-succinyltransferase [Psychromonas sp. MB-3u-54]